MSLLEPPSGDSNSSASASPVGAPSETSASRGNELNVPPPVGPPARSYSPSRTPTSAEIEAIIAAATANAPPAPTLVPEIDRSTTPLMTNLLPAAVGVDGRVNLFVGNLPYRVRWQDLKDLFRKAGTVLRADVSLGQDNRSRGYGTVLMGSREDAARAIDRFNGFNWQTRTLEVRPDRLPPEYEAQPHMNQHHHHPPPRPAVYTYHNMSGGNHPSFSLPGHLTPANGPSWLPGQLQHHRPPGSHPMHNHMSMPNQPPYHHSQSHPMGYTGSSPIPHSASPAPGFASLPPHEQPHNPFHALGAAPIPGHAPGQPSFSGRRDSLSPFAHTISPEGGPGIPPPRSASPAIAPASISRPNSSTSRHTASASSLQGEPASQRAAAPGSLGQLPAPYFASVKSVQSPETDPADASSTGSGAPALPTAGGKPLAMEGLAHQGPQMGPPSTLHDRVVFVSNLPLSMQWQELKDLLRPAGIIIRADVATDREGMPRGFGTALFASEKGAAKAVDMFNEREVHGQKISVHLEKDALPELISRRPSLQIAALGLSDEPSSSNNGEHPPHSHQTSPMTNRVPWGLDTGANGNSTPRRQPAARDTTPHNYRPHHPGPISMPAFHPLDTPGGHNPLSPLQTRGLPPMTPSMPGFVFNAYPETPPVHPHFMSPGLGPFSPGIPVTSPTGFQYNPFLNPAPGAPVNRFPSGGSAALGTPTTQVFASNPIHGFGAPGAPGQIQSMGQAVGDYFHQGEPTSPSARNASASRGAITPSRLNAKDRLASTSSNEVVSSMAGLDLNASSVPGTGPPTPTAASKRKTTADRTESNDSAPGRASTDGSRPNLSVWDVTGGERRASFGDIVAGRDKS